MPRGIKNRADVWEVRPIRKAPYVTAPLFVRYRMRLRTSRSSATPST